MSQFKKRQLKNISLAFVSVCSKGANQEANIVLKKENEMSEEKKNENEVVVNFDVAPVIKAVRDEIATVLKGDNNDAAIEAICAIIEKSTLSIKEDVNKSIAKVMEDSMKEVEAKQAAIEKAAVGQQDDVYKCIDGSTISKAAVGDAAFTTMKAMDAQIYKMQESLALGECMARVEKEYTGVAGEVAAKALLLKEAKASLSTGSFTLFESILKSSQTMSEKVIEEKGSAGGVQLSKEDSNSYSSESEQKLDSLAKAYAEKNNTTVAKAYEEVLKTEDGLALYNQSANRS